MLSTLQGQPVVAQHTGETVGAVADWVIDPGKGKVEAFELSGGRFVSPVDVLNYLDAGLVVASRDAAQSPDELVRVKKLLSERCRLIGCKTVTERGKRLGKVKDGLVDTTSLFIAKIYVQPQLWNRIFQEERIIPREQVVTMTPKQVVVRYDVKPQASEVEAEPAQ